MVDETIAEVISYNVSKAHRDAKLVTQEIEEWKQAMCVKITALIGGETWEMVLCFDGVKMVGCIRSITKKVCLVGPLIITRHVWKQRGSTNSTGLILT